MRRARKFVGGGSQKGGGNRWDECRKDSEKKDKITALAVGGRASTRQGTGGRVTSIRLLKTIQEWSVLRTLL